MMLRRDFILSSALLGLAHKVDAAAVANQTEQNNPLAVRFVSAAKSNLGEHFFVCLNNQFDIIAQHLIPARGHSIACSSLGHIAAVGRRPAGFCLVLDDRGEKLVELTAQAGRHFYGHGVYSADGATLYLTESNYHIQGTRGVVGIFDVHRQYVRVGEFMTEGIGPHEILLSPDGTQLIVANGGIQTHPETGRKKLNIGTMKPSLVYLDRLSGELVHQVSLEDELRYNSIRHLSLGLDGRVYIALQQQNKDRILSCLIARFDPEEAKLEKVHVQPELQLLLNGYVGDICVDHSGRFVAASSPKGGIVVLIDTQTSVMEQVQLDDVCGLTTPLLRAEEKSNLGLSMSPGQFIASTGQGKLVLLELTASAVKQTVLHDTGGIMSWDNHIRRIV